MKRVAMMAVASIAIAGCGNNFSNAPNLASSGSAIICLGDSITRGYGASEGGDYPSQLSRLIGRPVVNAGVDGDTTADALKRLERDVLQHDPWIVIVELSGNDLLQRVPGFATQNNLNIITNRIIESGAIPVLVHAKFGVLAMDPYRETFDQVAANSDAVLVSNVLRGILGNPQRMHDQIHPNDDGYALLAERVAKVVGPLIRVSERARGNT